MQLLPLYSSLIASMLLIVSLIKFCGGRVKLHSVIFCRDVFQERTSADDCMGLLQHQSHRVHPPRRHCARSWAAMAMLAAAAAAAAAWVCHSVARAAAAAAAAAAAETDGEAGQAATVAPVEAVVCVVSA